MGIVFVLFAGFALRYFGIPYGSYFSEDRHVIALAARLGSGDLNPGWFLYPSGYLYFVAFLMGLYFVSGRILGFFSSVEHFKYYYFTTSETFYSLARIGTVIMSLIGLYLVYRLAIKIGRRRWAVGGAALLAVSTLHMKMSFTIRPDIMMLLFVLLAVSVSVDISGDGKLRHYLLAGLWAGMAIGSKYPAVPVVITIFVAHLYACKKKGLGGLSYVLGRNLMLAAFATVFGFFIFSPYSFLDWRASLDGIIFQAAHYTEPFTVWTGPAAFYHLLVSMRYGAGEVVALVGLAAIIIALLRKRREDVVALSFPLAYFVFMGGAQIALTRYILPVLPFLCLYGAGLVIDLHDGIKKGVIGAKPRPKLAVTVAVVLAAACAAFPVYRDIRFIRILTKPNTLMLAAQWVERNVPPDSVIFTPFCRIPLAQSRKNVEDLLAWRAARGEPSVRERTLLANPDYPERPAYYVLNYFPYDVGESSGDASPTELKALPTEDEWKRIDYVAVCVHKRTYYLRWWLGLDGFNQVKKRSVLLKEFNPFKPGFEPEPIIDWMDDLFMPVANAAGVVYPGPSIWIFKVKHE